MKKGLCLFLAVVLLLSLYPAAFAAEDDSGEHPVLPDGIPEYSMPPVPEEELISTEDLHFSDATNSGPVFTVMQSGEPFERMTWTVTVTSGSGNYLYTYYVVKPEIVGGVKQSWTAPGGKLIKVPDNSFSYTFKENGDYELWVDVFDLDNNTWTRKILPVPVHVEGHDGLDFTVSMSGVPFEEDVTWTVNVTGGSGQYQYSIYLLCPALTFGRYSTITYFREKPTNFLSYRLLMSADYVLQVWVKDLDTNITKYKEIPYSFHSEKAPPISARVNEIVEACLAAGCETDYQKALWLHDWLTLNADYDYNYAHYGPDGVLLAGTGVCDSYAKAYVLLARAAGLQVEHIDNVVHAWNVVKMFGSWYYLDCTWDDPGPGKEYHLYFGLPYEIMALDHPNFSDKYNAVSYDCNYYLLNFGDALVQPLTRAIEDELQEGDFEFYFPLAETYTLEGYTYSDRKKPGAALCDNVAILLARDHTYFYGQKEAVRLALEKLYSDDEYGYAIVDYYEKLLMLPKDQSVIGAEAFMNDSSLTAISLPETLTRIDDRAFAGCDGLWLVLIPSYVTVFGKDVFDSGNKHLTLGVLPYSTAEDYAAENGLKFFYLEPQSDIDIPEYIDDPAMSGVLSGSGS